MFSSAGTLPHRYQSSFIYLDLRSLIVKIYIDESGDLGFSRQSSQYFVIAALIPHDELKIQRCFKKIRQNVMKKSVKEIPEFKFNNSQPEVKSRIFKCFAKADLDIAYLYLRKDQVPLHLRDEHQQVYNSMTCSLVAGIVSRYHLTTPVEVVIDKSLYGIQRDLFDHDLRDGIQNGIKPCALSEDQIGIRHVDSASDLCIQAVDFIAGAVHEHYRDGGGTYYPSIKNKVVFGDDYLNDP